MNSHALTITSDHLDIYLYDTREFGSLVPQEFTLNLWLNQGLANVYLQPHSEFLPVYHGDCDPNCDFPYQMKGAITLVDDDQTVLDQVEFGLDARTVGLLGVIWKWQAEMGWSREEVEERTWWAVTLRNNRRLSSARGAVESGIKPHE